MTTVELIGSTYYEVIDNSDCNAFDEWHLITLGPYLSWKEQQLLDSNSDELPF